MDTAGTMVRPEIHRVHEAAQRGPGGRPEPPPLPPGVTGAAVLDDARDFAASILYATDEMLDALTLACAVSHTLDSFSTVPELLFTSLEKESGKTTGEDIVQMLANNGWTADPTSYALRAKFNEPEKPTLIIDEVSDIFGRSGLRGGGNQLGKILRICYRRTASLSMAVDRVAEEVSCYTMAVMAGLKTAVPDDIRSRCDHLPDAARPGEHPGAAGQPGRRHDRPGQDPLPAAAPVGAGQRSRDPGRVPQHAPPSPEVPGPPGAGVGPAVRGGAARGR